MKNLKVIGLAMMAVLALSAIAASSASAEEPAPREYMCESTSGTCDFTATGEGNQVFVAGATVSCTAFSGQGSVAGTGAISIELEKISYTGCTVAGQAATVNMNGCTYTFDEPTGPEEGKPAEYTIPTIAVKCPEGKSIVITATTAGCTITVGPQTPTSTTMATNNATSPKTVTVNAALSKITSTSTGGVCGTKGTTSTATYTGKALVKAFSDAEHKNQVGGSITHS